MSEGKNLVGVDIGSSSIKLCELKEGRKGGLSVVRFGYHPLPAQTIVDGHVMNSGAVVEGLDKLFHKAKNRDVALRVSGHSVIIKKITMPLMTPAELREQIQWEAEQHIPFDLAEVEMDWQVLGRREDARQMDVLLVAAKKDEISDLTTLATQAKLRPRVIDLDAFTVQNAFEVGYGAPPVGQTLALLHVGASLTTLNILGNGTTAFTRDIANGGNNITEEIQRALGISAEEAEAYKCGGDGRGLVPREVPEIVGQVVEQLAGEIQRSLDFYLATSGDSEVHRVYVSGGSANIRSLLEAIERRARVQVERIDPLRVATPDPKTVDVAMLQGRAAQAVVAFGLALRKDREKARMIRVNLLPAARRQARAASGGGSATPWVIGYAVAALVAGVVMTLMYTDVSRQLREQLALNRTLEEEIAEIERSSADIDSVRAALEESRELERVVDELQRARFGPTRVLMELSHVLSLGGGPTVDPQRLEELRRENPLAGFNPGWDPRRLWLSAFQEVEREVTIRGVGRSNEDVAEFLRRLSLSELFESVTLTRTQATADTASGLPLIGFEMTCRVRY